ncbi:MAG: hypothetical protein KDB58_02040 [Solirubrobacterales bacterium]|nr:hypothetical protein [Solirubrobacterales bacterium]MCB8970486.1 hypothetical protein [Thermoleophilales bacterium]MCO5325647.1 hypothetical protein [Solirubrobacterales bacterium]
MPAQLENAHLADLHALAAELGVERFRMLSRDELTAAILERDPDATAPEREPAEAEPEEGDGAGDGTDAGGSGANGSGSGSGGSGNRRGRRGGRGGRGRRTSERETDEGEDVEDEEEEQDAGEPVTGILDITPRGHGFIRVSGLGSDEDDVYVSPSQIRRCEMRRGDEVSGPARKPRRGERYPALIHVDTINGVEPGAEAKRLADATPVHPNRRIALEPAEGASEDEAVLVRSIDLLNPLARGQRVLVEAAAGAGRTTLLRALAASLAAVEDLELVVLLIDERPEEVAEWSERVPEDALAIATAEMRSGEQLRLVELAFGRASRRAERGADVVLLVDSLSRIAVAADDPDRVKPIFGAGRETEEEGMGSLTVVATTIDEGEDEGDVLRALDTTESSRIVLDRALAAAGVYPAIDAGAARVAGEEHIREEAELAAVRALRAQLDGLSAAEAAARLRERIIDSADNAALLASLS